jgi:nitric oxide reductase NorD protein
LEPSALPELLASCYAEFPGLPGKIESLERALGLNGEFWNLLGRLPRSSASLTTVDNYSLVVPTPHSDSTEPVTEIEGRGQTDIDVLPDSALNGQENNLPEHVFEKTETLEEYNGLLRKSDDEDSLEEQEEALSEVNMKHLVRTPERPRSIYRADVMLDGLCFETEDETPGSGIPYPEWDFKKASYKPDWCFLNETVQEERDMGWPARVAGKHRRLIQRLKSQFATMTSEWLRMKRQPCGNEFDIDAVVNARVELRSGHTPSENLYQDRKRDLHDVAAMILLDQSYSTDAWLNDVRVLDVISESIYCVGEVLEDYIESFSIAGFASNTRRACRFNVLKKFGERWSDVSERLGAVQPEGYTRIGPALRHAHEPLLNQKASRKVVILLTDGRPCDYDRYEGKHGVHDVKKAIETGLQHGIHTHAFAIEKQAAEYFPQMFIGRHFDILPNPDMLSGALVKLFARLMAG